MEQRKGHFPRGAQVSRRGLLTGTAAAFAASQSGPALARKGGSGPSLAYVGSYTPNGLGIYLFRVESNGDLTQIKVFTTPNPSPTSVSATNPSWLAFDPAKKFLYAGNEISNFNNTPSGAVSAFSINQANGDLTFLNSVSSGGRGPAHHSVDPSGKWVLVANYGGGNVAVLPILADGSLGPPTDIQQDANACLPGPPCPVGPNVAQNAPPGSFARSGHDAPHAHAIETDPAGNFAIVNDLGLDLTIVWKFDRANGRLSDPKTFPSSPGAGPRHFAFHPNGQWFYSLNEEASTLAFMIYNANTGSLQLVSETSTLPREFVGTNFTSEVMVSPNGRFIYAANRLHDTIAIFSIDRSGRPELIGEEWTRGDYPRNFNIDPTGNFMYVCNHRGDSVVTFRIDGNGRQLKFRDQYTPVGSPAVIIFL
ncbi:MAG: lactonase family protein [Bryobacteraceae bacterium]